MNKVDFNDLSWEQYLTKLKSKSRKTGNPLLANLELTPYCNFNCKMCYVHLTAEEAKKIGTEHTTQEWIELGKRLLEAGTLLVLFTGGEVFTRPDFKEIYQAYSKMGFVLIVYSNGYLIDEETIKWLSQCPPVRLRITLYGASNETYERVTGVKNAFDKIKKNIEMIMKTDIPLSVSTTFIQENLCDFDNIREFVIDKNLNFIYTSDVVKAVRGAHSEADTSRLDIIEDKRKNASEHEVKRVDYLYDVYDDAFGRCESRNCGFWITWDGRMSICAFIDNPCSYPFEVGFDSAWDNLQDKLKYIKKPDECIDCKYAGFCTACPGFFSAETGHLDKVCESICEKAKVLYEIYSLSYSK